MNNKTCAKFNISGLVQGVGFRYFIYRNAQLLNLTGYAKNLYDGSVETVVEGTKDSLTILHDLLKQGPSRSRVDSVKVEYSDYSGKFSRFEID